VEKEGKMGKNGRKNNIFYKNNNNFCIVIANEIMYNIHRGSTTTRIGTAMKYTITRRNL
jgi:hypothetical protein